MLHAFFVFAMIIPSLFSSTVVLYVGHEGVERG